MITAITATVGATSPWHQGRSVTATTPPFKGVAVTARRRRGEPPTAHRVGARRAAIKAMGYGPNAHPSARVAANLAAAGTAPQPSTLVTRAATSCGSSKDGAR